MTVKQSTGEKKAGNKNESYRILSLHAENIKRIKVLDIIPKGNVIEIQGKNAQGKTSALDTIAMALGGKSLIPKKPIRDGEETGIIEINVGDYTITRHWTSPEKSYLKVENVRGERPPNPQNFLRDLVGDLAFDPLEFVHMDKSKRTEILKKITGLDFTKLDEERAGVYSLRSDDNKELKRIAGELVSYKDIKEGKKARPIEKVNKEYDDAIKFNREIQEALDNIKDADDDILKANKDIDDKRAAITQLENEIKEKETGIGVLNNIVKINTAPSKAKKKDTKALEDELAAIRKDSNLQYKIKRKKELEKEQIKFKSSSEDRTKKIADIDKKKKDMVSSAKMPIKGLAFGEDDVTYKDVEFSQISSAQQIEVAMSIAMAENPKLRIVRIMNGSLLDAESRKTINRLAVENDFQVWLEKISEKKSKGENVVYIEDGVVK